MGSEILTKLTERKESLGSLLLLSFLSSLPCSSAAMGLPRKDMNFTLLGFSWSPPGVRNLRQSYQINRTNRERSLIGLIEQAERERDADFFKSFPSLSSLF